MQATPSWSSVRTARQWQQSQSGQCLPFRFRTPHRPSVCRGWVSIVQLACSHTIDTHLELDLLGLLVSLLLDEGLHLLQFIRNLSAMLVFHLVPPVYASNMLSRTTPRKTQGARDPFLDIKALFAMPGVHRDHSTHTWLSLSARAVAIFHCSLLPPLFIIRQADTEECALFWL